MVDKIILELPADTVGGDIVVSTETRERAEAAAAQAEATVAGMVVSGTIAGDNLVLTRADSTTVVAGDVRGPKGNDGSNVLPTDTAIAQAISTPGSETQAQLAATLVADQPRQDGKFATKWAISIRDHGAVGDGATDDTAAIDAAIAALPTTVSAFGAVATLLVPAGNFSTNGGHVIPSDKRVRVLGEGVFISTLTKRDGSAAADLLTINSARSSVSCLSLDGNRLGSLAGVGHGLVLNGSVAQVDTVSVYWAAGTGIYVGLAALSTVAQLSRLTITECAEYGVRVSSDFGGSYDGKWTTVNIGRCGLSGFRLDAGSQTLISVHSWGNGWAAGGGTALGNGAYIASGGHYLVGCQFETNYGHGLLIFGGATSHISINGSSFWGNGGRGIYAYDTGHAMVSGCKIYRNGTRATGTTLSSGTAGLVIENGSYWTVSGNNFSDNAVAIPAQSYSYAASFPFAGRTAKMTQSVHIMETNGSNNNVYSGNTLPSEEATSGIPISLTGATSVFGDSNDLGGYVAPAVVAATTTTLPVTSSLLKIAGATAIGTITAGKIGRRAILVFTAASPAAFAPSNVVLRGVFVPTTGASIMLMYDGANWLEVSRSA